MQFIKKRTLPRRWRVLSTGEYYDIGVEYAVMLATGGQIAYGRGDNDIGATLAAVRKLR